jgi:hypothetical protein
MQGIFLVMTIAIVLANLLAELVYSVLDPRIRVRGEPHMPENPQALAKKHTTTKWSRIVRNLRSALIGDFIGTWGLYF